MKKLLVVSFLAVIVLSLMSTVAFAGGWTTISYTQSHDPDDLYTGNGVTGPSDGSAIWNPAQAQLETGTRSPHGFFSTTSNKCRVCHAVHMAGNASWRLLRDGSTGGSMAVNGWTEERGTDRLSECNYCHGSSGATLKRPFRPKDYAVKGEHTLGSTTVPDSSASAARAVGNVQGAFQNIAGGLSCGNCHTVHGSNSLPTYSPAVDLIADNDNTWANKILKTDPNGDGQLLAQGNLALGEATDGAMATDAWATLSNFCGDCHNSNPSWDAEAADDLDAASATSTAYRSNPQSHVQGYAADGSLEVYGTATKVANWGTIDTGYGNGVAAQTTLEQNTQRGCRGCHAADNSGNASTGAWNVDPGTTGTASAWPHQTKGAKLLFDTYTEGATQTAAGEFFNTSNPGQQNDATRILPGMDKLCARCHRDNSAPDANSGAGVGVSF